MENLNEKIMITNRIIQGNKTIKDEDIDKKAKMKIHETSQHKTNNDEVKKNNIGINQEFRK